MYKFRVGVGGHLVDHVVTRPDGSKETILKRLPAGTIIESDKRLDLKMANKFELLTDDVSLRQSSPFEQHSKETPKEHATRLRQMADQIEKGNPSIQVSQQSRMPAPNTTETFNQMSLKELQDFAASEEIDLGKAKSKEEILKVLRNAAQLV